MMAYYRIKGGNPLNGKVTIPGAKNAVTKLLVASLISDKKCILRNVPNIADVQTTVDFCKEIGMDISWDRTEGLMEVQTKELKSVYILSLIHI